MTLILWFNALIHPRRTMDRITCQHLSRRSWLIETGMEKQWHCKECGAGGFVLSGTAA